MADAQTLPANVQIDDCWRRIGVRGDGSCTLLATHIHCRNCPTYSRAATALLDGQAMTGLPVARPHSEPDAEPAGSGLSCLIFRVGEEWLALPTEAIGEVTAPCPVHSLPHRRDAAVLGVASVRGSLLACLSLARLFGTGEESDTQAGARQGQRFLVLGQGRGAIALPVAEVSGVRRLRNNALLPLPATLARASTRYSQALFEDQGRNVGLIDAALVRQALTRSLA
ncbi:chemotaxis protein CheW [Cupriavidus pinatubonensis]|uniref:chemotaxis protein CheW n=1 Tax=Cupriavidus pinatubonensis TaxID=248026 RepID=UPI00112AD58D|nr:chemotaxis protein CheW [Cupriavidus pinatubonensis]TPQ40662.1 chemotaxis protein CheR [Cupriavidus pinatubonensis]